MVCTGVIQSASEITVQTSLGRLQEGEIEDAEMLFQGKKKDDLMY